MDKLDKLQKTRNSKLNKASNLKRTIQDLMLDREYETVCIVLLTNTKLQNEAKDTNMSQFLPPEEKERGIP